MGGRDKTRFLADLADRAVRIGKQMFRFFAAQIVVIGKKRLSGMQFKGAEEIASVDIECTGYLPERKLFIAVLFQISNCIVCQFFTGSDNAPNLSVLNIINNC